MFLLGSSGPTGPHGLRFLSCRHVQLRPQVVSLGRKLLVVQFAVRDSPREQQQAHMSVIPWRNHLVGGKMFSQSQMFQFVTKVSVRGAYEKSYCFKQVGQKCVFSHTTYVLQLTANRSNLASYDVKSI